MVKFKDLTGKQFSYWTVLSFHSRTIHGARRWVCRCVCGIEKPLFGTNLTCGKTKSCGCSTRFRRPYEALYNCFTSRSKKARHAVSLTYEDFVEFTSTVECHYCKAPIEWVKHFTSGGPWIKYNLDRKDNDQGYSKENCVVCCSSCNFTKGHRLTYEEMVVVGRMRYERGERILFTNLKPRTKNCSSLIS
jgi:hypothetical protein